MKKMLSILLVFCMAIALFPTFTFAADGEDPETGLRYTIENGEVTITGHNGKVPEILEIPAFIEGYPVTKVAETALWGIESESVYFPDGVTEIGSNCLANSFNLKYIRFPEGLKTLNGFGALTNLKSVYLPSTLTRMENYAFSHCNHLLFVDVPDSVTYIGDFAFEGCLSLYQVKLSRNLQHLGSGAFDNCTSLEYIVIPEGVPSLDYSFTNCSSLYSITFHSGLKAINGCFSSADNLTDILYVGTEEQLRKIEILDTSVEGYVNPLFTANVYLVDHAPDPYYYFMDLPDENNWAYEGISFCLDYGYMNGMNFYEFQPGGTTTRAQLVTILWRMCEEPAAEKAADFRDTRDHWAKDAVAWAAENGIVNGVGEGLFAPDAPITREQLVTIFHRFCKEYLEMDVSQTQALDTFPDAGSVSDWAQDAMEWGVAVKLISGVATKNGAILQPQGSATRAQIAKVILNFFENVYTE